MDIHIPTPLRAYTEKQETVSVEGSTVAEGLAALVAAHPAMQQHLFTAEGKLRSFVNVYLNGDDVRYLPAKEATPVAPTVPTVPDANTGFTSSTKPATTNAIVANHCRTFIALSITLSS